jgi:hypothetical protein
MNDSFKTAMEQIAAHPILVRVQFWHEEPSFILPKIDQYLQMFIQMGFVDIDILQDGQVIRDTAVLKSLHDLPDWATVREKLVFQMKARSIWPLAAFAELIKNLPTQFDPAWLRSAVLYTSFHSHRPYELVHIHGGFMWLEVEE